VRLSGRWRVACGDSNWFTGVYVRGGPRLSEVREAGTSLKLG
jgi:hypothetical protein